MKSYIKEYIDKIIEEIPYMEEVNNTKNVKTPSAEYFFMVNPNATNMDKEKADVFHTKISKQLFLCKRARPYIQQTMPFLWIVVKRSDEDYYKTLLRMIKYTQGTRDDRLTSKINDATMVCWYADASFAVHVDMKSLTGGLLIIGKREKRIQ